MWLNEDVGKTPTKKLKNKYRGMKMKFISKPTLILALIAGLAVPVIAEENENEQTVDWKNVPAAVQNTITANANGGTVTKVEQKTKDGATVYEADVKGTDGKESEVKVGADGKLIKVKVEDQEKEGEDKD
jgi:hypothetical protein